jgi:hypothetical protein
MLGSDGRHGGAHTKLARFIGSRAHDGTFATPGDNDRLPARRWVIPLLDGRIEGVHVDVCDFAHTVSGVHFIPERGAHASASASSICEAACRM